MIKIGIISDTHNILRNEIIHDLQQCDYIIHAGDIMKPEILDSLKAITKVYAVKGNNDQLDLKEEEYFEIGGYSFYLIHEIGEKKNVDFYIYGHSHQLACYHKGKTMYLNPGSCGRKRFSLPLTHIILFLDDEHFEFIIKECKNNNDV